MKSATSYLRDLLSRTPGEKLPRKEIMRIMVEAGYTRDQVQYAGTGPVFKIERGPRSTSIWSLKEAKS